MPNVDKGGGVSKDSKDIRNLFGCLISTLYHPKAQLHRHDHRRELHGDGARRLPRNGPRIGLLRLQGIKNRIYTDIWKTYI